MRKRMGGEEISVGFEPIIMLPPRGGKGASGCNDMGMYESKSVAEREISVVSVVVAAVS